MGKAVFDQIRTILTNLGIGIETRMRLLKTYVWSVTFVWMRGLVYNQRDAEETGSSGDVVHQEDD